MIGSLVAVAALMLIVTWLSRGPNSFARPGDSIPQLSATTFDAKSGSAGSTDSTKPLPPASDCNITPNQKPNAKPLTADPILETHLQRATEQQDYEVLSQTSLPLRDDDKLHFHVTLNAPSYVYLYQINTQGKPERLWPKTPEDLKQQQPVRELWSPPLAGEGQKQEMYF